MSKTQLKKILSTMTAEQISEVLLDLYSARKEAKDYLEFFVNPDLDKRMEKAKTAITKECYRLSRHMAAPRITRIRKYINGIASLNVGDEPVIELMTFAVVTLCKVGTGQYMKDMTAHSCAKLLKDTVIFADKSGLLDKCVPELHNVISEMNTSDYYYGRFARIMRDAFQSAWEK